MKNIKILDCTLRDGGYCNEWLFGRENTIKIIDGLVKAGIDIVECGFLSNYMEEALLMEEDYQDKMAEGISKGILSYLGE